MFSRTRRKRNKKDNKKIIILSLCLLISIIILFILVHTIANKQKTKKNFETDSISMYENSNSNIFSIDKIVLYSSANGIDNVTTKDFWNLNIYQFTDIAIYINNNINDYLNSENTIKSLYIDKIDFNEFPEKGTPELYYKNIKSFGFPDFIDDNKIQDSLNYTILESNNSIDTTKAEFYTTCQTPITLEFVNSNIKEHAIIPNDNSTLNFDGSLLKKANISLNSIRSNLSFNINITNNSDEKFIYKVSIQIPLDDDENTIYNGFIKKDITNVNNSSFIKID